MDISVQPVGKRFDVTLSIKCVDDRVTIDIPTIKQMFISSENSRNFTAPAGVTQGEFPTLYPKPPKGDKPSDTSYPCLPPGDQNAPPPTGSPCLPPDYPLGGFVDTVDNAIPASFRPTGGLPIRFEVESKTTPGLRYRGYIDNQGWLQFAALGNYPLEVGEFETLPKTVTYYVVYTNRPGIYSDMTRPYLIWSDDRGLTWSNPINVSTDQSTSMSSSLR